MTDRRDIPGFEGRYTISSNGLILNKNGYVVFSHKDRDGYEQVRLYGDHGRRSSNRVHRLVCEAFHGQPPAGAITRHLDGDKANNSATNLAWGSKSENALDAVGHGTLVTPESSHPGEAHGNAKLTDEIVLAIRERAKAGIPQKDIAAALGITRGQICRIVNGKSWSHVAGTAIAPTSNVIPRGV